MGGYHPIMFRAGLGCWLTCSCSDDVEKDELEEYLSVLMDQEFDTILEDGSTLQVSLPC